MNQDSISAGESNILNDLADTGFHDQEVRFAITDRENNRKTIQNGIAPSNELHETLLRLF